MRRLVAWWHPEYEPAKFFEIASLIPGSKAKSKRVKYGVGESYQAERMGRFILVKHFSLGKRQSHMDLWFNAGHWPLEPFEQHRFVDWLQAEMVKRVFHEEWEIFISRQANAIVKAVNEVLGLNS